MTPASVLATLERIAVTVASLALGLMAARLLTGAATVPGLAPDMEARLVMAPPPFLLATLQVALAVVALVLTWYVTRTTAARYLAWHLVLAGLFAGSVVVAEPVVRYVVRGLEWLGVVPTFGAAVRAAFAQALGIGLVSLAVTFAYALLLRFVAEYAVRPRTDPPRRIGLLRNDEAVLLLVMVLWLVPVAPEALGLRTVGMRQTLSLVVLVLVAAGWVVAWRRARRGPAHAETAPAHRSLAGLMAGETDAPRWLVVALALSGMLDAILLRWLFGMPGLRDIDGASLEGLPGVLLGGVVLTLGYVLPVTFVEAGFAARRSPLLWAMPLALGALVLSGFRPEHPTLQELQFALTTSAWPIAALVACLAVLAGALRRDAGTQRGQRFWILTGVAIAAGLDLLRAIIVGSGALVSIWPDGCTPESHTLCVVLHHALWLQPVAVTVLAAFLVVGLASRGEIDGSRVFSRAALVGLFSTALVVAFAFLEHVVSDLFSHTLTERQSSVIGLVLASIVVHRARHVFDQLVARLMARLRPGGGDPPPPAH